MRFSDVDEVGNVRAVVGVDDADAAVLVDVVAAEEQVAHLEAELPRRVARRVPDLRASGRRPSIDVAFVEQHVDLARRHRDVDVLGRDGGVGLHLVAGLQRLDAGGWAAIFVLSSSLARARPWMWSASAWVAMIILQVDRLKSIARIRSMISSTVSS